MHLQVFLIRKDFFVTPQVKRYVNIYLIEGKYCYLVDSGVAGTQTLIEEYFKTINRSMEDINQQYKERPIPNFFHLLSEAVQVDCPINDGDVIDLEEGIRIQALSTKGHSHGSVSYTLNRDLVFTGDAIPVENAP